MRTFDHLEIKKECRNSVLQIMAHSDLGAVEKIVFDDQGWVNVTAFVNDSLVFRFNARDAHLPKFHRERVAFELLKGIAPVPELVLFDDSRSISRFDYMVCKRIAGRNTEENWKALSSEERESLAFQAGQLLCRIHSVTVSEFGELSERGPFPKTRFWEEYLRFTFNYHLSEAMELNLFSQTTRKRFLDFFESHVQSFSSVLGPRLIHGDFHFGNLLCLEGAITGVMDFEWASAGDPLWDICNHLMDMESKWPGSQDAFNRGYGMRGFTQDEMGRMKIYSMIKKIELCVVAKKFFPKPEWKKSVLTAIKQLGPSSF